MLRRADGRKCGGLRRRPGPGRACCFEPRGDGSSGRDLFCSDVQEAILEAGIGRNCALVPVQTARPFSMITWRSANVARASTFLSITRMAWRSALSRLRQDQISVRIRGARPSVASSRIRSFGFVIRARPMASICCSPPESCEPRLPRRSAAAGRARRRPSSVQRRPPDARRGRRDEVLLDGQRREDLAALGHQADPGLRDPVRRQARDSERRRSGPRRRAAAGGP